MTSNEIRNIFLDFFSRRDHQLVKSSSLIPADPTVLFTSAGMQQFIPYLSGEVMPPFGKAASCQKCFRTTDIDNIGDNSHHTFFEMLGNWSFGKHQASYSNFKEEAIKLSLELLTRGLKLSKDRLSVTIFGGEGDIPYDQEAFDLWVKQGIPKERIFACGLEDNFWGPAGLYGPCGPCSEIYYDRGEKFQKRPCDFKSCGPICKCGRFIEIWNLVFMEYKKVLLADNQVAYELLPAKNIDTGAGLERLTAVLEEQKSDYETELFLPTISAIAKLTSTPYEQNVKAYRIIADHLRAACFLIAEGITPSKEDRGYILRRLLRRAVRYGRMLNIQKKFLKDLSQIVIQQYGMIYPELLTHSEEVGSVLDNEEEKFSETLREGLRQFENFASQIQGQNSRILPSVGVFKLFDTYGFPFELTEEMAEEKNLEVSKKEFDDLYLQHQVTSRAGAQKKFGGVGLSGLETPEEVAKKSRLHTAVHLLHQALRDNFGDSVHQAGSDINLERLRFDFNHAEKLTPEQVKRIEAEVNEKIKKNLEIKCEEKPFEEAVASGALAFFKEKYPTQVKVYSIGDCSKEICAGPHASNTQELGTFKILKAEKIGAGIQRIKATLE